jgi:hypothetical protein
MTASNNSKMQLAVQMVIMDAIEKGHTCTYFIILTLS